MDRAEKEITLIYNGITDRYKVYKTKCSIEILNYRNLKAIKVHPYTSTDMLAGIMYYCDIKKAVKNNRAVILYRHNKMYVIDNESLLYAIDHFTSNRYLCYYDLFNMNSINAFMHLLQIIKSIENSKITVIDNNSIDNKQLWNLINMMY